MSALESSYSSNLMLMTLLELRFSFFSSCYLEIEECLTLSQISMLDSLYESHKFRDSWINFCSPAGNRARLSYVAGGVQQSTRLNSVNSVIPFYFFMKLRPVWGGALRLGPTGNSVHVFTLVIRKGILYLPVYKSIPCISWPPILEPKNKFFIFLDKIKFSWKTYLLS